MHKAWGCTRTIATLGGQPIHQLEVLEGGYCSRHMHEGRGNWFYVESGELQIEVWQNGLDKPPFTTVLHDREYMSVERKIYHRFTALKSTRLLEVYWADVDADDIVREDVGGVTGDFPRYQMPRHHYQCRNCGHRWTGHRPCPCCHTDDAEDIGVESESDDA